MKIYSKRGDFGQTDLLSQRVSKADPHISVNGAIDEAMSFLLLSKQVVTCDDIKNEYDKIHTVLFSICHEIALNNKEKYITKIADIEWLEERIDCYDRQLKPLVEFIKLDKTKAASLINVTRTTIRRAERELVLLEQMHKINKYTLGYLNRLSDYFFTVGRFLNEKQTKCTEVF
jgi:cob(I)alamin adenosyltransferase